MIDTGDIHLADLNEERRRRVLVMSNARFHRLSSRVLVAPEIFSPPDDVPFPWRIEVDGGVYAIDLIRSLPIERLFEPVGRASVTAMTDAHRALGNVTASS